MLISFQYVEPSPNLLIIPQTKTQLGYDNGVSY